jgi:hypothetical protein
LLYLKGGSWPKAAIRVAENYAFRMAALGSKAAIDPTEFTMAAFDPKRNKA